MHDDDEHLIENETIVPITCRLNLIFSFLRCTVFRRSSPICYYGPINWSLVPYEIKYTDSL